MNPNIDQTDSEEYIDIPEVIVKAKGGKRTWSDTDNLAYNRLVINSGFFGSLSEYNIMLGGYTVHDAMDNTKIGRSIGAAQNFLFLELPLSMVGREFLSAGWRAAGVGRHLGRALNYVRSGGPTFAEDKAIKGGTLYSYN